MNQDIEILVAEDSPTQAAQLKHILEQHGYRVSVARNGKQALASLREHKPMIVVSDVVMPEMDGYQLCREIKTDDGLRDIPVILLTSLSDPTDIVKGLECGADNFVTKPYEEKPLISRIQYILLNREVRKDEKTQMGMGIVFGGRRYLVTPERQQILDLLISTYDTAVQKNLELIRVKDELRALNDSLEEKVKERTARLSAEVTERKRAESELDAERRLLNALVDQLPVGVLFRDTEGRYTRANQMAAHILEIEHSKLIGMKADEVISLVQATDLDGNPVTCEEISSSVAIHAQRPTDPVEELITTPAGNTRRVVTTAAPVSLQAERPFGSVVVLTDVTEQYAVQEQLRQSQKMESIGMLAGGVAHDFNNLLTVITGYSDLLLKHLGEDDDSYQKVEEIKKAGARAVSLTRQLLAFGRKQVLQPRVLDLNSVVDDMDKMLRRLIGEDIDLVTIYEPELGQVKADCGQIEQVIMNLAVNARDAMPTGGKLTVETANVYLDESYTRRHIAVQPGQYVMLAVSDSGCGMDAATQARIFEPFFTTKEKGKGTGLGLSTVYGIVKQSGGNIWVYSEVDQGTTFKVYLPRVDEVVESRTPGETGTRRRQGEETILLVEDEAAVRGLARSVLEMDGYRVLEAANGIEAVHICAQHEGRIDLLLTDVVMPQMGGREVAEHVTQLHPETRVLYMSGYTDESIVHHGVLDPGVAFLEKPFTPEAVASKVREMLDKPQQRLESRAGEIETGAKKSGPGGEMSGGEEGIGWIIKRSERERTESQSLNS